ncbi:hypothetical protein [Ectopseudomonas oleovorans]|uniref:hypothetical protein n=1 Tax=Ectopseudomonas oleovorans TaxID=301 RepID=UPI001ABF9902|nr:hypothetical protein [Pseudomonas indoloxydans]
MAGNKSPSRAGLLLEYAAFFSPSQRPMSQDSNRLALSRRFSVAPMMDWKCFYIFLFKFKQIDKGAN